MEHQADYIRSLEQFADRTSQIIFSYDADRNKLIYLNPAFEQIWNLSRKNVIDNPSELIEYVHASDREYLAAEFQKIKHGEIKKDIEFRIVLPDKSVRWLSLNAFIDDKRSDRTIINGCADDQTSWKEKDEYTKKYAAKKNSVLEILSHDLAGPLNNISLASTIIAEKSRLHNDPELTDMINLISNTSERSIRLIREFVAQEFLESTSVDIIKKRVDMLKNLNEIIEEYKSSKDHIGKNFSLHSNAEHIYMKVDDVKFRQVINNLISNALKFTPNGGEIKVSIEDMQEVVLFKVADNGIGIPAKYQDSLFEKFTKARRTGLKGEPSIGLGMSIIKTIVDWHNGKIWFESEENKGSTFYIELPKE
ncbi:ATPase [Flammeovirgaceae bacterium 311]|nr:ATPase [Flammeovirgaceae bacterium 311]